MTRPLASGRTFNQGFRDLLHIANQSRPNIFDLEIRMPDNLYEDVVEVDEEVGLPLQNGPMRRSGGVEHDWYEAAAVRRVNLDRESVAVRRPVDVNALKSDLRAVKEKGITSLAVVLKHAALFPDHERLVGDVAKEMGFAQVRVPAVFASRMPPSCLSIERWTVPRRWALGDRTSPAATHHFSLDGSLTRCLHVPTDFSVIDRHAHGQDGAAGVYSIRGCIPDTAHSQVHPDVHRGV
jgi:hypothetical protein